MAKRPSIMQTVCVSAIASTLAATMAMLTVTEAAARYSLSGSQIRRLVLAGTVKGRKIGPMWTVDEAALKRYLDSERRPGPAPRKRR